MAIHVNMHTGCICQKPGTRQGR